MNEQDRARFTRNYEWFAEFFAGLRQFYGLVVDALPPGFMPPEFALTSGSYYFPRINSAPTMPDYYVLMLGGCEAAMQIFAVLDVKRFTALSQFARVPSIVVVLHDQPPMYNFVDDYGLRVISGSGVQLAPADGSGIVTGVVVSAPEARFAARQIDFDELTTLDSVRHVIDRDIVGLIEQFVQERDST